MNSTKQIARHDSVKVLLVDDEADSLLPSLSQAMEPLGFIFYKEAEAKKVSKAILQINPDVILLDLHFPGDDLNQNGRTTGGILLPKIMQEFPDKAVVLFTTRIDNNEIPLEKFDIKPHGSFAKEPFSKGSTAPERLGKVLRSAIISAKSSTTTDSTDFGFIVGKTKIMQEVATRIRNAASNALNVTIFGETGTGKELVAAAIHRVSGRTGSYVYLNCSGVGLDANTLESQIFGHERGAFTGATERRQGVVELADKGTLFLDEIQGIPGPLQDKLIKVIENGEFRRMGGTATLHSSFRLIVATNERLTVLVSDSRLRKDLAYRLDELKITLPPLRERLEDMDELVEIFVKKGNEKTKKDVKFIRKETIELLRSHSWGGNIRELENTIIRAVATTSSNVLLPDDIQFSDIEPIHDELLSTVSTAQASRRSILSLTDDLEALPLENRLKFLQKNKDYELRREVLIEFIRRLRLKTGKKVQDKGLAEALDRIVNDKDYNRIRQFVHVTGVQLPKLEFNK